MTSRSILQAVTPPVVWNLGKDLKRMMVRTVDHYAYEPRGWSSPVEDEEKYWAIQIPRIQVDSEGIVAQAKGGNAALISGGDDLPHVVFGYALAANGRHRDALTVLDYGGGLGDYYWVGRAFAPWLELVYHCKELTVVADAGRLVNPLVTWHTDDNCLDQSYDLTIFSSSLQYVESWEHTLSRAARASRSLLLTSIPIVRNTASFVATERTNGITHLHWVLNRSEIVKTAASSGLRLTREFDMGQYPAVDHAPEQPRSIGLLFQRAD